MKRIEAIATIKNSKLEIVRRDKFASAISDLPEGRYSLTLEKIYNRRSVQQNRAKFGIAYKILRECFVEATGESVSIDYVHEFCKRNFLPSEYVERLKNEHQSKQIVSESTGEVIEMPFMLTTTKMTTVEEMEFYANLQKFAAEFFGTEIPSPNEH